MLPMKTFLKISFPLLLLLIVTGFSFPHESQPGKTNDAGNDTSGLRIIHVFVSLCDNDSQGIVPVARKNGKGNDGPDNLFWGCANGVKTFFLESDDWDLLDSVKEPTHEVLERCVWKSRRYNAILVAEGYRGGRIRNCTMDFLRTASGNCTDSITVNDHGKKIVVHPGDAQLVCYLGHDGLMDFDITDPPKKNGASRDVIIISETGRLYFKDVIRAGGGNPLLWTTNLIVPGASTLKAAIDGWLMKETGEQIRQRAAKAYDAEQKCGADAALALFATGFY
ncbi:MAG TPA: hypothetical protein VFU15_03335 [Bacteroidia bacterium]|nr:hypothetical protein [Bacteroidia bacterium]